MFDSGRLCDDPKCRCKLKDTIINFGQNLPQGIYTSQCQVVNNTGITSSIILSIHNAVVLDKSFEHAERADLCLAMGSSLTVTPAADIPEVPYVSHSLMFIIKNHINDIQTVGTRGRRLVIINLQTTPLDHVCKLRIFAKCDDVSKMLMSKLGLEIPEFQLKR